ncbi:MAG: 30S ribosomal protein S16 [Polyangiaceae bacterium]|jgi:small subunit ribosomal protein S16|nr:30S ribosomal protein S16 [Polyangiaceae bacterium]
MAVHIRLTRHGAKKNPYYRIIVADQRSRRDGRFIEKIGSYNPLDASGAVVINRARLDYWTNNGAQLSATVDRLLRNAPSSDS